jgi:putative ABC transport system permease protein
LGRIDHVLGVTPVESLNGGATMRYGRDDYYASFQGVDPDVVTDLDWEMAAGTGRLGHGLVVVGSGVFGDQSRVDARGRPVAAAQPEDLVGKTITLQLEKMDDEGKPVDRTERVRVAGVLEEGGGSDDFSVYMDRADVETYNRWLTGQAPSRREGYAQVLVIVDDAANVNEVQTAIKDMGYQTFSALDVLKAVNQLSWIIQGILGGLGAVALIVAAFGIANTMTMAIYERTREIGIMKALGATNRDVLRIFLIAQNLLSRNTGGAVAPEDLPRFAVTTWWLLVFAVGFATIVGLLSGVYPALRAASMKPLQALRVE